MGTYLTGLQDVPDTALPTLRRAARSKERLNVAVAHLADSRSWVVVDENGTSLGSLTGNAQEVAKAATAEGWCYAYVEHVGPLGGFVGDVHIVLVFKSSDVDVPPPLHLARKKWWQFWKRTS